MPATPLTCPRAKVYATGLDSNAALVVMECMKRLAEQGRIIISSIHQPRAAIWDLFTKVQVLSEGRSLYFGPIHEVRLANLISRTHERLWLAV